MGCDIKCISSAYQRGWMVLESRGMRERGGTSPMQGKVGSVLVTCQSGGPYVTVLFARLPMATSEMLRGTSPPAHYGPTEAIHGRKPSIPSNRLPAMRLGTRAMSLRA